jgi:PAS domain S-box-containing protein
MKEKEFLAAVLSVSGALVIVLDTDGRIVRFNEACERATGHTFAEVKGNLFWDILLAPEEIDAVKDVFRELRAGQFPNQHENDWVTKSGGRRRIMWSNTALFGKDGRVEFVIGTGIDVTEHRQAEMALNEYEARWLSITQSSPDQIMLIDKDGTILAINHTVPGLTVEQVIGTSMYDYLPDSSNEVARKCLERVLATGRPGDYEAEYDQDGSIRYFESCVALMQKPGDEPVFILSSRDITDRKMAEKALRESEERLRTHQENLEALVKERAAEIVKANENLEQEIKVRRKAEDDLREALLEVARLKDRLEAENLYLQEEIKRSHDFEEIVGESATLRSVLDKVQQVASTDASVLITGETGTGKELLARAIHSRSSRKTRPLVRVNCSALPGSLIENELFGHEKGAFTGAFAKKIGRFELADGGTILLDEIGDLSTDIQIKLLRVLQEGEFERIGSAKTLRVNVRIIAATNRNVEQAVADGTFRSDLFYRLNVFPIHVPPLRERLEDIPLLVSHIIRNKKAKVGKTIEEVPREVLDEMMAYDWPGNVRELENVIAHSAILSPGKRLELCELFGPGHGGHGAHSFGHGEGRISTGQSGGAGGEAHRHSPEHVARANRMVRNIQDMGGGPGAANWVPSSRYGPGPAPTDDPNRIRAAAMDGAPQSLQDLERVHIQAVVEKCGWKISGVGNAADLLGINASTLRSRMKKLGIVRPKGEARAQSRAKR